MASHFCCYVLGLCSVRVRQGKQWQGRQWQLSFWYSCSNTFCIFVSFVNIGQLQLFWLLYQMPYIYWWLMKDYSITPKDMYTISQLNDRCLELLFCYISYYYMSLFMCAWCMCWIAGVCVHLLSFLASWQIVMHFKFTFNKIVFTQCTLCIN